MPTVFITGAGKRIGRGLAKYFAENGWDIVLHYKDSEKSINSLLDELKLNGIKAISVKADLRNEKEVFDSFNSAIDYFGALNVLVNNAAVFPARKSLSEMSINDWDNTISVNLRSAFITSKFFAESANENSRIINIASLGGLEVWRNRIAYNVSKSGLIQLTKVLARNLAPKISVNCVCPGAISIPDEPGSEPIDIALNKIPMERYGNIRDICESVYFFATASNYITGQVMTVDGGLGLVK
jgi:NAD(P)-dependent dehydrogenase (short-subunit alcohol dehydrogenase family)